VLSLQLSIEFFTGPDEITQTQDYITIFSEFKRMLFMKMLISSLMLSMSFPILAQASDAECSLKALFVDLDVQANEVLTGPITQNAIIDYVRSTKIPGGKRKLSSTIKKGLYSGSQITFVAAKKGPIYSVSGAFTAKIVYKGQTLTQAQINNVTLNDNQASLNFDNLTHNYTEWNKKDLLFDMHDINPNRPVGEGLYRVAKLSYRCLAI
jgi:hypothetical protein